MESSRTDRKEITFERKASREARFKNSEGKRRTNKSAVRNQLKAQGW